MNPFSRFCLAAADTLHAHWQLAFHVFVGGPVQKKVKAFLAEQATGSSVVPVHADRLASYRYQTQVAEDGCVLDGRSSQAWAKFAIPKGLPQEENERRLAIENEPHYLNETPELTIHEGYGAGRKVLVSAEDAFVKVKGETFQSRVNYHFHDAKVAGEHWDLVVEGLPPQTADFEVHIPRGPVAGRYAFVATDRGTVCLRMKDRTVRLDKPTYSRKTEDILPTVDASRENWVVERKLDGSLGCSSIHHDRAFFRSHRDVANVYTDKLPAIEYLHNRSRLFTCRTAFPGPDLDGTVLQGELVHADGAARVSGILNAHPSNARRTQAHRGPVEYFVWDIAKYKGRDVRHLPYAERRDLYQSVVADIRLFNKHWHVVEQCPESVSAQGFYQQVVHDPRGLPWAEGLVIKRADSPFDGSPWLKVKFQDTHDLVVVGFIEGTGKFGGSLGAIVVENPETGAHGEVGSFRLTDEQRQWIWDRRADLEGQTAEIEALELTERGVPRAGVFVRWHPQKSDVALRQYSESLAGTDPEQSEETMYKLKSAAGWRR